MQSGAARIRSGFSITMPLFWWTVVCAFIIAVGIVKAIHLLLIAGYAFALMLPIYALMAYRMAHRVSAKRDCPEVCIAGEMVRWSVVVKNDSAQPCAIKLLPRLGSKGWFVPHLAASDTTTCFADTVITQRCLYALPPVRASSDYPIGIVRYDRLVVEACTIAVLPPLGSIDHKAWLKWLGLRGSGESRERRQLSRRPADGDVRGIRAYRHGDSARDIHWKSSARRNQILVREYDRTSSLDLLLILDPTAESETLLDWATSLCLTMAMEWSRTEEPGKIALAIPGVDTVVNVCRPQRQQIVRAFEALASLTFASPVAEFHPKILERYNESIVVFVGGRRRSPLIETCRIVLPGLQVVDPETPALWYHPPGAIQFVDAH